MTNTTASAAGGAMPKIDSKALMIRAWAIFRQTYKFPKSSSRTLAGNASRGLCD
jgi:hypothetical protein